MERVRVGVAGYGVIGQRLADGVAAQEDMEVVGVSDVVPTLSLRALAERGMPYPLYAAMPGAKQELEGSGIPFPRTCGTARRWPSFCPSPTSFNRSTCPGSARRSRGITEA